MEKHIERLIDGQFEYDRGVLEFSEQRIEIRLLPDETAEGSFKITGPADKPTEGIVSSTELRMEVLTPSFSGSGDTISYRFDSAHLVNGDVLQGDFRIISNRGEYLLPFVVSIDMGHVESTLGNIRNLFHFTNLAKTDWKEAQALFLSDQFEEILTGHDAKYISVYRGLKESPDPGMAMEEFLLAARKKQPVEYLPEQTEIRLEAPDAETEEVLSVSRNGWGHTALQVTCDGAFLKPEKTTLSEKDFVGNTCRFRYKIDPCKMHRGNNYGSLTFSGGKLSFTVRFLYHIPHDRVPGNTYLRKKRLTVSLMNLYASYRMRRITQTKWLQDAGEITGKMCALDEHDPVCSLYQAHYMISASRLAEAAQMLDDLRTIMMHPETEDAVRCYYLFLNTRIPGREDEADAVARQIRNAWFGNPGDWRIAWLLQQASSDYAGHPSRIWDLFKEQYGRGMRSPVIYIEALMLAAEHPAIFMRLDAFELALLGYAAKKRMLPVQLIDRVVYLARHSKQYTDTIYEALGVCYEIRPDDDTLSEICAVLIKGARTDRVAHEWYEKGVAASLRLTRLYEYYMMSITVDAQGDASHDIPRSVLMYFSHGSDLDWRANAVLYRYVYEKREQYPEFYPLYEPRIGAFVERQVASAKVDATLAWLYKKFLRPDMVNADNARSLLRILYTCVLTIEDACITEAIVLYDKLTTEYRYPVTDGVCVLPLYGSEYTIILSDSAHNRYVTGISYETVKYMVPGRLAQATGPFLNEGDDYINYFLCEQSGGVYSVTMENVAGLRTLSMSGKIEPSCREAIRQQLIRFYHENDFTRQLTEALEEEDLGKLVPARRSAILELMVIYGNVQRAYKWIRRFGTYGVDPRTVMRMCSRLSNDPDVRADKRAVNIMYDAFRNGKYDNHVLEFLQDRFRGTVREMRDVWKAAASFGLDTYALTGRMLSQMLYSGAYVGEKLDIFRDYVGQGAKGDIESAFLAQSAYDHFVKESVTGDFIYRRIGRFLVSGGKLPAVCAMDYLKYFASHRTGEFDQALAERLIGEFLEQDIYFPFFADYADVLPGTKRFQDRVMLQYRTMPGRRVIIHYTLGDESADEGQYLKKRMTEMYDSIYCISFVLFFGEELQYYITEEGDGKDADGMQPVLTESGTLSRNDIRTGHAESDRFAMINDLCVAEALKDYETYDRLVQDFFHTQFLADYLFRLRETDHAAER